MSYRESLYISSLSIEVLLEYQGNLQIPSRHSAREGDGLVWYGHYLIRIMVNGVGSRLPSIILKNAQIS